MTAIEREMAILGDLSYRELALRWKAAHSVPPPKGMSRRLLLLALAYQLQADAYGALDSKTSRYLDAVAAGSSEAVRPLPALKPGMRLMREWNGRTHVVDVTDEGLLWGGETYPSLSAIARAITGARWSPPLPGGQSCHSMLWPGSYAVARFAICWRWILSILPRSPRDHAVLDPPQKWRVLIEWASHCHTASPPAG